MFNCVLETFERVSGRPLCTNAGAVTREGFELPRFLRGGMLLVGPVAQLVRAHP